MVKAVVYMKSGLGDIYPFLAMLPEIMKEKEWKKEDMKFFIDNIYLLQPERWRFEKNSTIEMLKVAGIEDYEIVPIGSDSSGAMDWPSKDAEINGPKLGINFNKNDFLFWRFPHTKEFMKKQVSDDCIFIDDMLTEHVYEWSNGEYKKIDYKKVPLNFIPEEKEKKYIDDICTGKHLLIHVRLKGKVESIADFSRIIKHCKEKGIKCILIGLVKEGHIMPSENIIDLRSSEEEKISPIGMFYLSAKAKLMVTSSSGWTYHRLCHNFKDKKTIASYARHRNDYKAIISKEHLENPNHVFFDADEDNVDKIIKEIDEFWGGK